MTMEEAKELLIHVLMTYEPRDQYGDLNDSQPYEEAITMAIEALSAEAVEGEWMNAGVLTVRCSNCKSEFHELEAMNFCPNCGARMEGGDDE